MYVCIVCCILYVTHYKEAKRTGCWKEDVIYVLLSTSGCTIFFREGAHKVIDSKNKKEKTKDEFLPISIIHLC